MRNLIAAASIILLGFAAPAFSQALGDMDYSGRFGGMPPGTVPDANASGGGISIPFDTVGNENVTVVVPPERTPCPKHGTRAYRAAVRNGTLPAACR
ncbi:hypothetical protein FHX08_002463 [Rhizobium sp. BK529]|uniref:hypothetical protein n=1 Tax=unclassified Rhizobium TaxID=2613769 RepID=UPI00104E50BC|nr:MULTISPECIES: hypothetical protein [unclassified Rhizobium]MBB3592119.1 hypothetical protein [Rhizobium sp. BK529]TCS06541.1 hypothetical protein EV281_102144 [Rhizobium sp. BK418]